MFPFIGPLISGGLSLLGGLFGQQNQADINSQNVAAQQMINSQNVAAQERINAENIANAQSLAAQNTAEQEKFAQMGVQWRTADARAAGINPLAALGAQTASFSNNVGATAVAPSMVAPKVEASNAFGSGVSEFGQNIGRAIQAMQSPEAQAVAVEKTRQDLEAGQLDNDLKRAQLASVVARNVGSGPGVPVVDKGGVSSVDPRVDLATVGEHALSRNPDGSIGVFASRPIEGTSWASELAKLQYDMRTWGLPVFGRNAIDNRVLDRLSTTGPAQPGERWNPNPFTGEYEKTVDPVYYARRGAQWLGSWYTNADKALP